MSEGHPSDARRPDRAALVVAVLLACLGGVIIADMARLVETVGYSPVGPSTVPRVIGFVLIGLAVWTAVEAWRDGFPKRAPQQAAPVAWIIGGLAAQLLLLSSAGFSIGTGLLFAATARGFGYKKLWFSVPVGIVFAFVVWAIFSQLLQLRLPAGPLESLFF